MVVNSDPVQSIQDRFHLVAVLILAGEVDDRIHAQVADLQANHIGGEGGVASGIIGNGEGMDPPPFNRLLGEPQDLVLGFPARSPAGNQLQGVYELSPF